MSKRVPLGLTVAIVFLTIAVTVAVTVTVYMNTYNKLIQDLPQRAQLYSKLSDMDELVRANYYGSVDSEVLDASIAKGYIDGLNDRYSFYLSAEEYAEYYSRRIGNVSGTGIEAEYDEKSGMLLITSVASDSPAEKSGISAGDFISSVDDEAVTKENASSLLSLLGGEKLTGTGLSLYKAKEDKTPDKTRPYAVNVAKGFRNKSVTYSSLGTVGYINISAFYDNTAEKFSEAITSLNNSGITGLIIDVRGNTSDNLEYAADVVDLIVPLASEGTGAIATVKNSSGETIEHFTADAASINLPIVVLADSKTNGAAELLTCDLRDFGKARIIGETTAGHGTMQSVFRLDDGGAVVLTVGIVYPYISDSYNGKGVAPDEAVKTDVVSSPAKSDYGSDAQLSQAIAYLSK